MMLFPLDADETQAFLGAEVLDVGEEVSLQVGVKVGPMVEQQACQSASMSCLAAGEVRVHIRTAHG